MTNKKSKEIFKGKAETRQLGNDLFWELRFVDKDNSFDFIKVKWTGYNDAFWWEKVAPTEQARVRKGANGKSYRIDFNTNEVWEIQNDC